MPKADGEATVESKAGRVEIDAKFDHIEPATRFGPEYLTYVLWAITPEGHAKNLGEVLADASNRAHLQVTTDLQTFGLIMTAEPYAAVRQPGNLVVVENEIRRDTVGHIEPVQAKYELLPRGHYTYTVPPAVTAGATKGEKLPMDRYEALLEVYQAQNAVQIAKAQGADRYAADTYAKAEQGLRQAQEFYARKVDRSTVVTAARQAAQTAEDARTIAAQRKRDEELALARSEAGREQQLRAQAEADAQRARVQASADRQQLEQERFARQRAEAEAAAAARVQAPPPPVQTPSSRATAVLTGARNRQNRAALAPAPRVCFPYDSPRYSARPGRRSSGCGLPRGRIAARSRFAVGARGLGTGRESGRVHRRRGTRRPVLHGAGNGCPRRSGARGRPVAVDVRARLWQQPAPRSKRDDEPPRRDHGLRRSDRQRALLGANLLDRAEIALSGSTEDKLPGTWQP